MFLSPSNAPLLNFAIGRVVQSFPACGHTAVSPSRHPLKPSLPVSDVPKKKMKGPRGKLPTQQEAKKKNKKKAWIPSMNSMHSSTDLSKDSTIAHFGSVAFSPHLHFAVFFHRSFWARAACSSVGFSQRPPSLEANMSHPHVEARTRLFLEKECRKKNKHTHTQALCTHE